MSQANDFVLFLGVLDIENFKYPNKSFNKVKIRGII